MRMLITLLCLLLYGFAPAQAGEELPKGPPWHRDFVTAHAEAAKTGKPIFVYFTKTY